MIRSLTCVCALLAGASGLYLYSEKHRTTLLDQQISKIVSDTQQIRERTSMLRAEWALLNQPDRLQQLSGRFLPQLGAMAPTQFVQLASLDARLPAVGPENPPHPIATPQTAPSLVGAKPEPEQAAPVVAEGAAIAQAEPSRQAGHVAATAVAQAAVPMAAQAASQMAALGASPPQGAARNATRLAQARPKPLAHRDIQLADAETGDGSDIARQDVVSQAALRRVVAHPAAHAVRVAAPVRLASAGASTRAALSAVSSTYARPPVIAAAAWHPARANWPVARPASYSVPSAGGTAIGSSLGSSHASLPAPVPVSDGN